MPSSYADKFVRLSSLVSEAELRYEVAKRQAAARGTTTPVRHKCFVSYHGADIDAVTDFVDAFKDVFIPRVIGVSDSDAFKDPVNSKDEDYIKQQIGAKYLSDSTVTILYVGSCAWSRKYIDWELASSLRDSPVNKRNGLLAITPPNRSTNQLPDRLDDNLASDGSKYARYYYYPTSEVALRSWIEDAFQARTSRQALIDNTRSLRRYNSVC
jgi:hypothetical protein